MPVFSDERMNALFESKDEEKKSNAFIDRISDNEKKIKDAKDKAIKNFKKNTSKKKKIKFNEDYRNGCEDVDLYLRAENLGYRIGVYKDFRLPHKEGSSEGRLKYLKENILLFNKIWKNKCQIREPISSGV